MSEEKKNIDQAFARYLPVANIARIMKKALPQNAKIAKDTKDLIQQCVSEFISFITSEAGEKCKNQKRKTICGQDILSSITVLGFQNYSQILRPYLAKYKECVSSGAFVLGEQKEQSDEQDEQEQSEDKC